MLLKFYKHRCANLYQGRRSLPVLHATPSKARIEASTACQLACVACPTPQGIINTHLGTGLLKSADFEKFLVQYPQIRSIELSNFGEVFLNPQLVQIFEIAHQRAVEITLSNGVNFNRVSPQTLQAMVDYQVAQVTVALDGVTQETYQQYRVRGRLETVLNNVRQLNQIKQQSNSEFPVLTWQFVEFDHNRHEIEQARQMAQELGMAFVIKRDWRLPRIDPPARPGESRKLIEHCLQLWHQPQINFDGRLLGCCCNYWSDFGGNVFESDLQQQLNQPKIQYARAMLQGHQPPKAEIACTRCIYYKKMLDTGNFITPDEVLQG